MNEWLSFDGLLQQALFSFLFSALVFAVLLILGQRARPHQRALIFFGYFVALVLPLGELIDFVSSAANEPVKNIFSLNVTAGFSQVVSRELPVLNESLGSEAGFSLWLATALILFVLTVAWPLVQQKKKDIELKETGEDRTPEFYRLMSELLDTQAMKVIHSSQVDAPFVSGFFSYRIFLPDYFFEEFSENQQRAVLLHEMAHVIHRDALKILFARTVMCLFWFFPLVYWAYREMRRAQEEAADLHALVEMGAQGKKEYAEAIWQVADRMQNSLEGHFQLGLFNKNHLIRRFEVIQKFQGRIHQSLWLPLAVLLGSGALAHAAVSSETVGGEPLKIETKIFKSGKVVAQPRVIANPEEDFEVIIGSESEEEGAHIYSLRGSVRYVSSALVELDANHCVGATFAESESFDVRDYPRSCDQEFTTVVRLKLGREGRVELREGDIALTFFVEKAVE